MSGSKVFPGLIHLLGVSLWKRLGSCPRCMHSAFRAAFMTWLLTGFGLVIPFLPPFLVLTTIAAFALTALWLGHLLMHAIRVSTRTRLRHEGSNSPVVISRRGMLTIFTRTLATAALATSIPALAFADCDQAAAEQCETASADCRASCGRSFHREEATRACHQECYSHYVACKTTKARCP